MVTLTEPDDSKSYFESIRWESEVFWADTMPNKMVYGYQIQQHTKWRDGLQDTELQEFEKNMGFSFPVPLWNFYKTMNGLSKHGINLYGNDGTPFSFRPILYSYPEDLHLIHEQIEWICEATSTEKEILGPSRASRIFPVYGHRFMLIDIPGNPILSMYGNDIIYYADNLSKLLANEIFGGVLYNVWDFESPPQTRAKIRYWLD